MEKALRQTDPVDLVVEEQEIEGVIVQFADGLVTGYRWKLHVRSTLGETSGQTRELPWVFASREAVRDMLAQWQQYLSQPESLDEKPPGSTVQ